MSVTHVYTLLRWDVKWFNFCQHTLLVNNVCQFDLSLSEAVFMLMNVFVAAEVGIILVGRHEVRKLVLRID